MERENLRQRLVEANSTGSQGSRRAVEPGGGGGGGGGSRGGGGANPDAGCYENPRVGLDGSGTERPAGIEPGAFSHSAHCPAAVPTEPSQFP